VRSKEMKSGFQENWLLKGMRCVAKGDFLSLLKKSFYLNTNEKDPVERRI
jgi:hypothetical protein